MKKVIFCAVALMIGAVGLSQTTPTAPTAPASAEALPGIIPGLTTANRAHAIQNGSNNKVAVKQIGTSQNAYSDQGDGTGSGGNQARILQTGNVQAASGVKNNAQVMQRGTENQSTQYQFGDKNKALTNQGMNDSGSEKNRALIQQGATGAQQGEKNLAQIDQDGYKNQARTQQRFDKNEAFTDQDGDKNYADIGQNASPNNSKGHAAEITQNGNDNDAWTRQEGNGARNEATAVQFGDDNYSWQEQDASAASGNGNNAAVVQGTNVINPLAASIDTYMDTHVDSYHVGNNFNSVRNQAFQFQDGDDNIVAAFQTGEDNYSEQHQEGDDNEALVAQNFYDPNPANGNNYAKQTQDGDDNTAGIGQNGSNHKALQSQIGSNNRAYSTQQGQYNDVNVHQRGNSNYATTAQRAQDNDILVVQYDGQSAVVEQNLTMPGGNNTANIYQSGPDGGGGAIDCSFDPQLPMTPRNPIDIFNIPDVCQGC